MISFQKFLPKVFIFTQLSKYNLETTENVFLKEI